MATFTNQATLSYRNTVVNSNVVSGEIVGALAISKDALLPTYGVDDNVTYIITIVNSGNSDYTNVSVTDDLGAYEFGAGELVPLTYVAGSVNYYVNGILQADPAVVAGPSLVISGLSIPAGGNATVIYNATVNEYAPLSTGGSITNTATASYGAGETISDSATITVEEGPVLDIVKAISPATVSPNGQLTYTFTIRNYGNTEAVATDNVVVTDTFDPILDPITVTYNGTTWTAGTEYTYNSNTGEFATVAGNITVPAATYTQNPVSGEWTITPGEVVLRVVGTI